MKPSKGKAILACAFLVACSVLSCSGGLSDGGQSGTGIAAIRGTVVAVTGTGTNQDVADIRVSVAATDLVTRTDSAGRFELRGKASGPAELRFEREEDGLFAHTTVVIPAGGVLELSQIMIDGDSGEVHPAQQHVQFQGIVETVDCAGGMIRVTPKDNDPQATTFTVEVASATIRRPNGQLLACSDLRVGNSLQVDAETTDGLTLFNAQIVLEQEHVQFQGIVTALDCTGGTILVNPNDDDPAANVFTAEVASATIRRIDGQPLACSDLRVGDSLQVEAETTDGLTLFDAEIMLEERERVQFQGIVTALDCTGGTILVTPNDDDPAANMFTVEVASATIRRADDVLLTCGDLRIGDSLQVDAVTTDGMTLLDAEIVLEDTGSEDVEFQGIVTALDCAGGTMVVTPNDDDPQAIPFTVELASATIRRADDAPLACSDLRVGVTVQVDAVSADEMTLVDAEIVVEDTGNEDPR